MLHWPRGIEVLSRPPSGGGQFSVRADTVVLVVRGSGGSSRSGRPRLVGSLCVLRSCPVGTHAAWPAVSTGVGGVFPRRNALPSYMFSRATSGPRPLSFHALVIMKELSLVPHVPGEVGWSISSRLINRSSRHDSSLASGMNHAHPST